MINETTGQCFVSKGIIKKKQKFPNRKKIFQIFMNVLFRQFFKLLNVIFSQCKFNLFFSKISIEECEKKFHYSIYNLELQVLEALNSKSKCSSSLEGEDCILVMQMKILHWRKGEKKFLKERPYNLGRIPYGIINFNYIAFLVFQIEKKTI